MKRSRKRIAFIPRTDLLEERKLMSVGVNLNTNASYAGDPIWVDLTHSFQPWKPYAASGTAPATVPLTKLQYPLADATTYTILGNNPNGLYQFSYEGTGSFRFGGAGNLAGPIVLGADGISRGSVSVDKSLNAALSIIVTGLDPNNPLHDVHLIVPGYSADTTQVYTDVFLNTLQPFDTLRTMDWSLTNGSTEVNWQDRIQPGEWSISNLGVSWENIIELGNESNKDIWINVPAMATDDYVRQLAQLVYSKLAPTLKVHVEYSNETWNTGFRQYQQVLNAANANPLIDGTNNSTKVAEQNAFRAMQISNIFNEAYGADRGRVSVELGGFFALSSYAANGLSFINSNFGSPSQYFSSIAVAPYIYMDSSIDKSGLTVNSIFVSMNQLLNGWYVNQLISNKALASSYGLPLDAYEGGQSLTAPNGLNYAVKLQAQSDPRMAQLYTTMLTYWDQYAGGDFVLYSLDGLDNNYGFWGLMQHADDPGSVKFDAVMRYVLPAGDVTLDGKVTWDDFQTLVANYGSSGQWWKQGDFNGDGVVNITDFELLKSNMDYSTLTSSQIAQIAVFGQQAGIAWSMVSSTQVAQQIAGLPTTIPTSTALVFSAYGNTYLSNMTLSTVKNGSGAIGRNQTANGSALRLNWFSYANGLSVYGDSQVDVTINKAYTTFQADIGLDSAAGAGAAVTYQVWADGVLLYTSPVMTPGLTAIPISVDVTGRTSLSLQTVMSGVAAVTANIADWGAARLSNVPKSSGAMTWQLSLADEVISTTTSPSFVFRGSAIGIYTITAVSTAGGVTSTATTKVTVGPARPWSLTTTPGDRQATVNWSSAGAGVTYVLYRGVTSSSSTMTLYKSGLTGTQFVDTGLTNGTTYYYAIAVVSADGIQGPLTPAVTVRPAQLFTPTTTIAGDTTLDGKVTWADFQTLVANYGKTVSTNAWVQGDFNGDGIVNITDFELLKSNMDYSTLTSSQIAQIAVFGQQAGIAWSMVSSTQVAQQIAGLPTTIPTSTALVFSAYGNTYLSNMTLSTVKNGSGAIGRNQATNGKGISLRWNAYANGVSVNGDSQVDVAINKAYTVFQADIGLDSSAGSGAAATYQVWADGVLLYTSPRMTTSSSLISISVDVTGRSNLSLRTIASGTVAVTANVANWGAARLSNVPKSSGTLTWQVSLAGKVISTTASPSFVFRPSAIGIYTITAVSTAGGVTSTSSTKVNVGPASPWSLTTTSGNSQATINWSSSVAGVTYVIYRGLTSSPGAMTLYKSGLTGTQYVDTGLTNGLTYYYAIAVVSAEGIQGPLTIMTYAKPKS